MSKSIIEEAAEFWAGDIPKALGVLNVQQDMNSRGWESIGYRAAKCYEELITELDEQEKDGETPVAPQKTLLDFGCGGGANLFWFKKMFPGIVGLDVNDYALDKANEIFNDKKQFLFHKYDPTVPEDIADLPLDQYSSIICTNVVRYLPSVDYLGRILEVIKDLLMKNGTFIIEARYSTGPNFVQAAPYAGKFKRFLTMNEEFMSGMLMERGLMIVDTFYEESAHSMFFMGIKE
jgi:SAM-dependent methyltransferase